MAEYDVCELVAFGVKLQGYIITKERILQHREIRSFNVEERNHFPTVPSI